MSRALRCRPSSLVSVSNPVVAFMLDRAVTRFGEELEAAVREATDGAKTNSAAKSKAQRVMNKWLAAEGSAGRFRDPAAQ